MNGIITTHGYGILILKSWSVYWINYLGSILILYGMNIYVFEIGFSRWYQKENIGKWLHQVSVACLRNGNKFEWDKKKKSTRFAWPPQRSSTMQLDLESYDLYSRSLLLLCIDWFFNGLSHTILVLVFFPFKNY